MQSSNSNDQYINQLQSELSWERDVVQQDLLQKLTTALTMLEKLCDITKGLNVPENHAEYIAGVTDFYEELRNHKLPLPVNELVINTDDDHNLPF